MYGTVKLLGVAALAAAAKAETEVVLAHYNEDLSWVSHYESGDVSFTVYTKAEDAIDVPEEARRLPNVGRESHTYLTHILQNYDNLAEWTVFSQAGAPSHGYQGSAGEGGHLTGTVTFADYLQQPGDAESLWFFSNAVELNTLDHAMRLDFTLEDFAQASNDVCPAKKEEGWTKFFNMRRLSKWLLAKQEEENQLPALDFYHKYVALTENDGEDVILNFSQGARFALTADQIKSRPKSFYEALLNTLTSNSDPIAGYWLEYMWYDVFHPEHLQEEAGTVCDVPYYAPVSQWEMIEALTAKTTIPELSRRELQSFTSTPTDAPTAMPTVAPTKAPTAMPTAAPTKAPTAAPSWAPTAAPTDTAPPTVVAGNPTRQPTDSPSLQPTRAPSVAITSLAPTVAAIADVEPINYEVPLEFPADGFVLDGATATQQQIDLVKDILIESLRRSLGLSEAVAEITGTLEFVSATRRRLQTSGSWQFIADVEMSYEQAATAGLTGDGEEATSSQEAETQLDEALSEVVARVENDVADGDFNAIITEVMIEEVQEDATALTSIGIASPAEAAAAGDDIGEAVLETSAPTVAPTSAPTVAPTSEPTVEPEDEDDDEIAGLPEDVFYVVVTIIPVIGLALLAGLGYWAANKSGGGSQNFGNVQMT